MKNVFRSLFAVVLATVMVFASITAFATEDGKTLNWDVYNGGYIYEFEYAGDFSGDKLVVDDGLEGQEYIEYYEVDIPQAGYYVVSIKRISGYYSDILFPESIENGVAYGKAESQYLGEEIENEIYTFNYLYYFSAGENILGLIYSDAAFEIGLEFFGETVTDIDFADGSFSGIFDYDFWKNEVGEVVIGGVEAEIIFSSGEKLSVESGSFVLDVEDTPVKGENEAEVKFYEYRKPVMLTVFEITDYIEKVELNDSEGVVTEIYYNGDTETTWLDIGRKFSVTFTDGTTAFADEEVVLPNGKTYFISTAFTEQNNGKTSLLIEVAFYNFCKYELTETEASFADNLQHLSEINTVRWSAAKREAERSIACLGNSDSLDQMATIIFWFPTLFTSAFYDIFCNVVEFAEYCAVI